MYVMFLTLYQSHHDIANTVCYENGVILQSYSHHNSTDMSNKQKVLMNVNVYNNVIILGCLTWQIEMFRQYTM